MGQKKITSRDIEHFLRCLTRDERDQVMALIEKAARKSRYGQRSISSVFLGRIIDQREARYAAENEARKRRRAWKREGRDPMGRRITPAQKRRNSMRRDANGMATYPDDGE